MTQIIYYLLRFGNRRYFSSYAIVKSYDATQYNSEQQAYYGSDAGSKRLGEGIWETSNAGSGFGSWNGDFSDYLRVAKPVLLRGGMFKDEAAAGLFSFHQIDDNPYGNTGFRAILIINS